MHKQGRKLVAEGRMILEIYFWGHQSLGTHALMLAAH